MCICENLTEKIERQKSEDASKRVGAMVKAADRAAAVLSAGCLR